MRILTDNPGPTFTRNLDGKFVDTVKDLLRNGRDLSVKQMLMEMLDSFEHQKGWDEGLEPLIELWRKEKDKAYKAYGVGPCLYPGLKRALLTVAGTSAAATTTPKHQCASLGPSFAELLCEESQ